ncbi:MAG: hypothetical protein CXR30_11075 [Geobacter sp.]|nr:MAG: hypothetical protein CXR30_11075 [Geobacter sp.]
MAEIDIIRNMIFQPGQSQDERMPRELGIHHADVDEQTPEDLLRFTRKFAAFVSYFRDNGDTPDGDWSNFFPNNDTAIKAALADSSGETPPHLALFLAFLELYQIPREVINRITGRHLDFYYRDVLRLAKKGAVPDRVHLLLELKKNAQPVAIGPEQLFSAGKDTNKKELIYRPVRTTIINAAKVDSLRSLFVDSNAHGRVLHAPVANSADGLGNKPGGDETKWHAFGHNGLQAAETGFALASPVLRMREGTRKVTVTLTIDRIDPATVNGATLKEAFEVFITGEKHWLGPYAVAPTMSVNAARHWTMTFSFSIPETEKGVIDYDPLIHGYSYSTAAPVLQVLLKDGCGTIGYNELKRIRLLKAAVAVDVANITTLTLENDGGTLDPKKAFLPFGSQPTVGSRFMIGCGEALSKKLSQIKITVKWKDAPANFTSHYDGYDHGGVSNTTFTAAASFSDGGSWNLSRSGVQLFETANASTEHSLTFSAGSSSVSAGISQGMRIHALNNAGSLWAVKAAHSYLLRKPVFMPFKNRVPEAREGFITLSLEHDFLHSAYRKKYVEKVMTYSKQGGTLTILNEPYTPAIGSISLSYRADSDLVNIAQGQVTLDDFSNPDLHFYHIAYFGQMREHGYQRRQFGFLRDKSVYLFPPYDNEGELLVGFTDLRGGDSVSVLFQAAEGSADPELPRQDVSWSVLCDNYWKPLDRNEVILDTTNQLLTSGIITFVIPEAATTDNTILPDGRIWLKAAVSHNVSAVSQLIAVAANALEVHFTDNDNDPGHLLTALEKGSISKLKNGLAEVKSVKQPYGSFGGRSPESNNAFHTRVSERLRHKNRCVTPWDYERITLEAFPNLHKVKCIPHATPECWLRPGNVLIVVVPDLKNKNAINPLEPKVDADTLNRITEHLGKHAGMQVKVQAKNPRYQKIQLDFKVKFQTGCEPNFYTGELGAALTRFLSPWAYQAERSISFGATIYKSVLLDFVEELDYVDYVTDFKMYSYSGEVSDNIDRSMAQPETPDAILVSANSHSIREV